MPSAPFVPLSPSKRVSVTEAMTRSPEKEAERATYDQLIKRAREDKEALEAVGGKIETLRTKIQELADAEALERAKPDDARNDAAANRLQFEKGQLDEVLTAMLEELGDIKNEIADLQIKQTTCEAELANYDRIIGAEYRANGEVPNSILDAYDDYEEVVKVRDREIEDARERFAMAGVEAMEGVIRPYWGQLNTFLKTVDETKLGTAGLGLHLPQYPVLDPAKNAAFVTAFEALPGTPDQKARAEKVRGLFEAYTKAREAFATDSKVVHLKALEKAAVALKEIPNLWGPENEAAEVQKRRTEYEAVVTKERKRYEPQVTAAEKALWGSLAHSGDRELLVKARLGEAVPAAESKVLEALKTEDGRADYLGSLLAKIGMPLNEALLTEGLAKRLADAQAKGVSTSEQDLLGNWRDDMIVLFDPRALREKVKSDEALGRVQRLGLTRPTGDVRKLLVSTVGATTLPNKLTDQFLARVNEYFTALKDPATPGAVVKDPDQISEALITHLGELFQGFDDLLTDQMQPKQKAASVPSDKFRPNSEEVIALIERVEAVNDPTSAAKLQEARKAREFVEGFVASMERATLLEQEHAAFSKIQQESAELFSEGQASAKEYADLRARKEMIEDRKAKILSYLLERELAPVGETPDTTARGRLQANWPTLHDAEVASKKREVRTAQTAFDAAKKKFGEESGSRALTVARYEVAELRRIVDALDTKDIRSLKEDPNDANFVHARNEALQKLPAIDVSGTEYKAKDLLDTVLEGSSKQPLKDVSEWIPSPLRNIDLQKLEDHAVSADVIVAAEYARVERTARAMSDLAQWFEENRRGRAEPGKLFGINYKTDNAWRTELNIKFGEVLDALRAATRAAEVEHAEAERRAQEAKVAGKKGAALEPLLARQFDLYKIKQTLETALLPLETVVVNAAKAETLLPLAYSGLRMVTFALTRKEPQAYKLDANAFRTLVVPLMDVKQDIALSTRLIGLLQRDQQKLAEFTDALPRLAYRMKQGPEVHFAQIEAKLAQKEAALVTLRDAVAVKQTALDTAVQELATLEAETLPVALQKFDAETSSHLNTVIDPEKLVGSTDEIALERDLKAAEEKVTGLRKKATEVLLEAAKWYAAWLDKKRVLMVPTAHPTDLEETWREPLLQAEKEIFTLFEKQGATDKTDGRRFMNWFTSLNERGGEGMRKLMNELVPGLAG